MYRKIRGMKASDISDRLGMKEASYTKYERGETAINVDMIQQIAEILKVDPIMMLSVSPNNIIENCSHFAMNDYHNNQTNEQQNKTMLKLMENVLALNERMISILEKKEL